MIPSHCAIFNLEPSSGGRVVYEDNIVNNINSSLQPGIPVLQLTSYTGGEPDEVPEDPGDNVAEDEPDEVEEGDVTSIQNKKPWTIKKTKCQEISDPAAVEEILNPKKKEVKEETKAKRAKKTPLQ